MPSRVLIVEDEQIVAADLEWQLTREGYEVVGTTASGEEAIAMAESRQPDVVLMDVRLQGPIDGAQAADEIWAAGKIPIIFISAFAISAFAQTLERQGRGEIPGAYLSKPFSSAELMDALSMVLKGTGSRLIAGTSRCRAGAY